MHSIPKVNHEKIYHTHAWLRALLNSNWMPLSEETKLKWRKVIAKQENYPIETQLTIAEVAKKYYWCLEIPQGNFGEDSKRIAEEWLKVAFLSAPNQINFKEVTPFKLNTLKSLLLDEIHPSPHLINALADSKIYAYERLAIPFLKKALVSSFLRFRSAKKIIDKLLKSENDAIVIATIILISDFPSIFTTFPEKEFWLLSERSEAIQKAFFSCLKYWGDHELFGRVLDGDSWSVSLKVEIINRISHFPSKDNTIRLFKLLKQYPNSLGPLIVETLYTYKLGGISFSQNQQNEILIFWGTNKAINVEKLCELVKGINNKNLTRFCADKEVPYGQIIEVLEGLNNNYAIQLLIDYYRIQNNKSLQKRILKAFVKMNCSKSETQILMRFDFLPNESMDALYYIGGEKTIVYLKNKLGFNVPVDKKINYYPWEEKAVKFLIESGVNNVEIIQRLMDWNIPYLHQILTNLSPKVDATFFDLLTSNFVQNKSGNEIERCIHKVVSFEDIRGLEFLGELLIHDNETIREKAFLGFNELVESLYKNRKITPSVLLRLSVKDAIISYRTTFLIALLMEKTFDFSKQEILLRFLLIDADKKQLKDHLPVLLLKGNLHIEKIVLTLIGNTNDAKFTNFILPYLNLEQDIFRLRQALIAAKNINNPLFDAKIVQLLSHRNMNIKKAAVDYFEYTTNFESVPVLFKLLRTNDNIGLREAVISALKNNLKARYFTFLWNELLQCETKREISLITDCFEENEKERAIWVAEQEGNIGLISLFPAKEKYKESDIMPYRKSRVEMALKKLDKLDVSTSKQAEFIKALEAVHQNELIILLDAIRIKLIQVVTPSEFLLKVLYDNGGLLTQSIAYKGTGVTNLSLKKWVTDELVKNELVFSGGISIGLDKIDLQVVIDYFYNTDRLSIVEWVKENDIVIPFSNLAKQYAFWEYKNMIWETTEITKLNLKEVKRKISVDEGNHSLFLSLVLDVFGKQNQFEFILLFSPVVIKELYHKVYAYYNELGQDAKFTFVEETSKRIEFEELWREEKVYSISHGYSHFEIEKLSSNQYNALRKELLVLLEMDQKEICEKSNKFTRLLVGFSKERELLALVFKRLLALDLIFEKEFNEVQRLIMHAETDEVWDLVSPVLEKGELSLFALIESHASIQDKILELFDHGALGLKIGVLKWLHSFSEESLYFPGLLCKLLEEKEQSDLIREGVYLMVKLCRDQPLYISEITHFIENQLLNKGEERQHLILDLLIDTLPKEILSNEKTRKQILNCGTNTELTTKAISCILKVLNWNLKTDVQFFLSYLKGSKRTLTKELIADIFETLEDLEVITQLEIYNELFEIPILVESTNAAVLKLFSTDYQVLTLLNKEKQVLFFEDAKKKLYFIQEEVYLRAIIKSMSLFEVDGYTNLMEDLLQTHRSSKIRSLCLRELKKQLDRKDYLDLCNTLLTHKDVGILQQVIKTLSHAKQSAIVPALLLLVESKKTQIKKLATNGILILDQLALPHLEKARRKCRPDKRKIIEELIGEIEYERLENE